MKNKTKSGRKKRIQKNAFILMSTVFITLQRALRKVFTHNYSNQYFNFLNDYYRNAKNEIHFCGEVVDC